MVALGQGAFLSVLRLLQAQGTVGRLADYPFSHGAVYRPGTGPWLVASYHTSRYNIVITSYSIHYTKLYDSPAASSLTLARSSQNIASVRRRVWML